MATESEISAYTGSSLVSNRQNNFFGVEKKIVTTQSEVRFSSQSTAEKARDSAEIYPRRISRRAMTIELSSFRACRRLGKRRRRLRVLAPILRRTDAWNN